MSLRCAEMAHPIIGMTRALNRGPAGKWGASEALNVDNVVVPYGFTVRWLAMPGLLLGPGHALGGQGAFRGAR